MHYKLVNLMLKYMVNKASYDFKEYFNIIL